MVTTRPRLLVVDFDYFFPNLSEAGADHLGLFDWGHAEIPLYRDGPIWQIRAAQFLCRGLPLPRCETGYREFWRRFRLAAGTPLWIADSNAYAATLGFDRQWRQVWLYDAHHDSGYQQSFPHYQTSLQISCEDWTYPLHAAGASIHVRYPPWRHRALELDGAPLIPVDRAIDDRRLNPRIFEGVFVCRSGAWVPAWCDDQWQQFLDACPIPEHRRHVLEDQPLATPRWGPDRVRAAEELAVELRAAIEPITR
jgi:hypothetical protein